jgi:two-component system invasion response regulator UvrY
VVDDTDTVDVPTPVDVVIVDDHDQFRAAVRAVISRAPGFRVAGEAATGEDGVVRCAELAPALVIMDINLPGIDGIEATRRIVADRPDAVVVLCSSYEADALPASARTCGASTYVNKEAFSPSLLRSVWDEHRPRG